MRTDPISGVGNVQTYKYKEPRATFLLQCAEQKSWKKAWKRNEHKRGKWQSLQNHSGPVKRWSTSAELYPPHRPAETGKRGLILLMGGSFSWSRRCETFSVGKRNSHNNGFPNKTAEGGKTKRVDSFWRVWWSNPTSETSCTWISQSRSAPWWCKPTLTCRPQCNTGGFRNCGCILSSSCGLFAAHSQQKKLIKYGKYVQL